MESNFQKSDLLLCEGLVRNGFNMMGYRIEEEKIMLNARSLLKLWKNELVEWNDITLEDQFIRLIEAGELEKLTVPIMIRVLKARYYSSRKSSSEEYSEVNYTETEREFLTIVADRIKRLLLFDPDETWRHLSLFHIVVGICDDMLEPELKNNFYSLKSSLESKSPGHFTQDMVLNSRGTFVIKPEKADPQAVKIIHVANQILRRLHSNRNEAINKIHNYTNKILTKNGRPI